MRIYGLELNNDLKGVSNRKVYIESLIEKLDRPDFVVLPELSLCSYMGNESLWKEADENSQDTAKWAISIAKKYQTYIGVGYLEKADHEFYNSYLIADQHQVYGIARKSEGESYIFKRGNFDSIISTPLGNIAVAICYDSRRKHFYQKIMDQKIVMILFPHGSPNDPYQIKKEMMVNDSFCQKYLDAFLVPVIYVNSTGKMDFMVGKMGKMMLDAGFRLNGLSKIYSLDGKRIETNFNEAIGIDVELLPKERIKDIKFYGDDINQGNFLFRKLILKPEIKAGILYYEKAKKILKEN
jgi:omega-amidase